MGRFIEKCKSKCSKYRSCFSRSFKGATKKDQQENTAMMARNEQKSAHENMMDMLLWSLALLVGSAANPGFSLQDKFPSMP